MSLGAVGGTSSIRALLGPTNTGKTHRAVERMLEHPTGMIGLPLRLLAREIYDRLTLRLGESQVALVTGEEKRVGPRPRYWVCTTEAMPLDREVDFVAIDEIQLAGHAQRGHVFTHRLLHARGLAETWLLGSDTMRPLVERLVPTAELRSHPRLSTLRAAPAARLGALPPRSAVIAFSVPEVYELADRVRRRRGGAAVVHGALSPRTRNAQVAMYQAGEVDCLVATDAIGMGLNLDIDHVAFAELHKFDGRESRVLSAAELAQIAGRAGRHCADGTFGALSPRVLPPPLALDIENHRFPPVRRMVWRNAELDTRSIDDLLASLRQRPTRASFQLVERADDTSVLGLLADRPEIRQRAAKPERVALLWEVCQVPDFRRILVEHHAQLLAEIFMQLSGSRARLDPDWLDERVRRLEDTRGSIDELLMRMEAIRIWSYVAHRSHWLDDARHWQERARSVEDSLSEALHLRLVERFVERRARGGRARPRGSRAAGTGHEPLDERADGGHHPFRQLAALGLSGRAAPARPTAADQGWVDALCEAHHALFGLDAEGRVLGPRTDAVDPSTPADREPVARLCRGTDLLHPEMRLTLARDPGAGARSRVTRRLVAYTRDLVEEALGPLRDERLSALSAAGRGVIYQLEQGLGTALAAGAEDQLRALTARDRELCAAAGIELGAFVLYAPALLKPDAVLRRVALCTAFFGRRGLLETPASSRVSLVPTRALAPEIYSAIGYPLLGPRAVRADVAERAHARLREMAEVGPLVPPRELGSWLGCNRRELGAVVRALGFDPASR